VLYQPLEVAVGGHPDLAALPVEELLAHLDRVPEAIRTAVRNSGGGHANHTLYWHSMAPNAGGEPTGWLARAIGDDLGGFDAMKDQMSKAAATRFGSGWAWLSLGTGGKLVIESTANQDTPLSEGSIPLLTVDVWEHAYYLQYQNRRPDYITAWWNTVNWREIGRRFEEAKGRGRW
jgi:Fe-Mn family superoxide dismutase